MNDQRILRYFLGGNTYRGFYSLYDSFVSLSEGNFLWVLKGGPGCGKSSFMKMLGSAAEKAGLSVEYAVCSGDPSSLDGVFIPELKTAYTDGTAPHIADANMAGVDSAYINLGEFYDYAAISEYKADLKELYRECSASYKKAYSLIAAAGALQQGWQSGFPLDSEKESVVRRANGIALREFGKKHREKGQIKYRFLSALTCRGLSSFPASAEALCDRFYVFENRFRLGDTALQSLTQAAVEAGHDVIVCPNPLTPEVAEAVLIPSLSLGFLTSDSALATNPDSRCIRLDALVDRERIKKARPELRRSEKMTEALVNEGYGALSEAKRFHDQIEGIFNPNVDFDGVNALVQEHIEKLGLK
ncbi:MAG: hypothetical protein KBI01_07735 [Oscillospiraceae bacterium]|nr:hypothetical protein [Oscillospiraceae bacterium]